MPVGNWWELDGFSKEARRVVESAQGDAISVPALHYGVEHLVASLLRTKDDVVRRAIASLSLDPIAARAEAERRVEATAWDIPSDHSLGDAEPTGAWIMALERARKEALRAGATEVDVSHVALAVVGPETEMEGDDLASVCGADADALREAIQSATRLVAPSARGLLQIAVWRGGETATMFDDLDDSRVRITWLPLSSPEPTAVHFLVHDALQLAGDIANLEVTVGTWPVFFSPMGEVPSNAMWSDSSSAKQRQVNLQLAEAESRDMIIIPPYERAGPSVVDALLQHLRQRDERQTDDMAEASEALSAVEIAVPSLVRAAAVSGDDLAELLRAVEALLGNADRILNANGQSLTETARRELEIACDSLAPQLLSTSPNVGAVAALFGQIVSVLSGLQAPDLTPEATDILAEASRLGSEDPEVDGEHARAVVQRVFDHATEVVATQDPTSSGVVADVVNRVRQGAIAGWPNALDDVERRAQALVQGLPGVVANGVWLSAAAIASTGVQLAATDPRLTAGTGLVAVVLRFVLAAYSRRARTKNT